MDHATEFAWPMCQLRADPAQNTGLQLETRNWFVKLPIVLHHRNPAWIDRRAIKWLLAVHSVRGCVPEVCPNAAM